MRHQKPPIIIVQDCIVCHNRLPDHHQQTQGLNQHISISNTTCSGLCRSKYYKTRDLLKTVNESIVKHDLSLVQFLKISTLLELGFKVEIKV